MKHYASNPRQITSKQLTRLRDKLARLGDLSGVVHNQRDDSIIGGNQRMVIFGEGSEPVIVERYEQPDEQGTLAHGFIIWQDKRYAYRLVNWDEQTAREANIAANLEGGAWDWDVLANSWPDMGNFGFGTDLLDTWSNDFQNLSEFIEASSFDDKEKLDEISQEIRPRKLLHILISVDLENSVESVLDVREQITEIEKMPGIEVVYGAN
jgi:hypothetical protein